MEGAVFLVSALIELQSAPLDAACFYSADSQPFGLFSLHGTPKKTFHAMKAFRTLLDTPLRIAITTPVPSGVRIAAGVSPDLTQGSILLADSAEGRTPFRIRYRNTSRPSAKLVSTVVINETGQGTIASESPTVKDLDGVLTIDPHGPVVLFLQFQLSR